MLYKGNIMEVLPIYELPFHTVFFMFIIFSFVGWCSEVVYVGILSEHKFVNRGFLHGPICPIYGCGGLVILFLPKFLYTTWLPLFFASMILCSIVEYFASWLLEKMFHTLWWDYSHYKINLKGRICLLNAVLFGIMGVLSIHFVIPYVMLLINSLGDVVITNISRALGVVFTVDLVITIKRLVDYNTTMARLKAFRESIRDHYENEEWFQGESLGEMLDAVKAKAHSESSKFTKGFLEKIEAVQQRHSNVESFIKRFPTLKSTQYKNEIEHIKSVLKQRHR